MKKVLFQRGPDGKFHEYHSTPVDDPWQPIPGQDWALIDPVHGAGWFIVDTIRLIYRASSAHDAVALRLQGLPDQVYLEHMEVYLKPKPVEVQITQIQPDKRPPGNKR